VGALQGPLVLLGCHGGGIGAEDRRKVVRPQRSVRYLPIG
jgi:hypothetical protein